MLRNNPLTILWSQECGCHLTEKGTSALASKRSENCFKWSKDEMDLQGNPIREGLLRSDKKVQKLADQNIEWETKKAE